MYQSMDSSTKSAVTTSSRVSMLSAALVATREATGMTEGENNFRLGIP